MQHHMDMMKALMDGSDDPFGDPFFSTGVPFAGPALRRINHHQPDEEESYEELLRLDEHNVKVGLKPTEVEGLTAVQIIKTQKDLDGIRKMQPTCVICLEEFEVDEKIRRLQCTHVFHANCIDEHFKTSKKCPIDLRELK